MNTTTLPVPDPWDAIDCLAALGERIDALISLVGPAASSGWAATAAREAVLDLADDLDVKDEALLYKIPMAAHNGITMLRRAIDTATTIAHGNASPEATDCGEAIEQAGCAAVNECILLSGAGGDLGTAPATAALLLRLHTVELRKVLSDLDHGQLNDVIAEIGRCREQSLDDADTLLSLELSAPDAMADSCDIAFGHLRENQTALNDLLSAPACPLSARTAIGTALNSLPQVRLALLVAGSCRE